MIYTAETPIFKILRLTPLQKTGFLKLRINTLKDLLYYFPIRYSTTQVSYTIDTLEENTFATIYGTIKKITLKKLFNGNGFQVRSIINTIDNTEIECVWFNQPYISKMYHVGDSIKIDGKIQNTKSTKQCINPQIEKIAHMPIDRHTDSLFTDDTKTHTYIPIYKETKGITSRFLHNSIKRLIKENIHATLEEPLSNALLQKYALPHIKTAFVWMHIPQNEEHQKIARKRFAFQEIYLIQLQTQYDKYILAKEKAYTINTTYKAIEPFVQTFPFGATLSQKKAVKEILQNISEPHPMGRLLEGDVGSGKTFVAACAAYAAIMTRPEKQNFGTLQVAYMTPTEILAEQQFNSFIEYFAHTGIQLGLITSSGCKKFPSKIFRDGIPTTTTISKKQLTTWIANGEINIVIGTHSLIQKTIEFKHLALTIIDEQHRFGMNQRKGLARKDLCMPHLLSMTATPIPRTLALTIYGGLDITLLEEMPSGRKKVITEIALPHTRDTMYEKIRREIEKGRQVYIICPRIDGNDDDEGNKIQMKSVNQELVRLQKDIFKTYVIKGLHSKLSKIEKEKTMSDFVAHKIDILVCTSVIEVGVNIPNASVIVIEGAERFGLAQLHQLRGRVQRGTHQPYCFLFSQSKTIKTLTRLESFIKAKNGFELAEFDLVNRGPGELTGTKQWGVSDLAMEALKNIKLVEIAQKEARASIQNGFIPHQEKIHHFE